MGNVTAKTSGEIASFMTPVKTNIKSLKVHFSPKQLGTGDPSPENVREIVGWDGVEVNGSGKNLINLNTIKRGYRVNIQGEVVLAATYCLTDYIPVFPSSKYYLSNAGTLAANACTAFYDKNKELLSTTKNITPITTLNNCAYIRCSFRIENIDIVQLEKSLSPTSYEPYQGNTISYQWKLPDEYQEVEYIESDGNSYLSIPYLLQRYDEISTKIYSLTNVNIQVPFSYGIGKYQTIIVLNYSDDIYIKYFDTGNAPKIEIENNKIPLLLSIDSTGLLICKNENNEILGMVQSSYKQDIDGDDKNLYLFIRANKESAFYGRNYGFKITNNNTIKLNLVPCYRKSDGEIGMYDAISQIFFTNQGTGTFLKGEDVNKTFYGGYVDLISGELVEEWKYLNLDNLEWYTTSQVSVFRSGDLTNYYVSNITNFICNKYTTTSRASTSITNMQDLNIKAHDVNDTYIYIKNTNYTDVAEFKSNLIDCNMVYLLQNPITHQLTPTQLSSFIGQNNFWSNADYVEIEYELKETEDIQKARKKIILNQPHIESITGDAVSFTTNMKAPLKECKVYFEPVQEGEDDPSPENVRNITGWDKVEVKNGDNIYSIDWTNDVGIVYGGYVDLVKGELVATHVILEKKWSEYSNNHAMTDVNRRSILFPYERRKISAVKALCNIAPPAYDLQDKIHFYIAPENNYVYMFLPKDLNEETLVQIVSKIETPIYYQLTPQQILSFKGINNFNCGIKNDLLIRYWNYKKSNSNNIAYEAKNLTFDGTNYIDTGVYLFSEKNINRDFEVMIEDLYGSDPTNHTIVCAKYDSTAIGFLIRLNGATGTTYKGTISMKRDNHNNITIKRINGVITIEGEIITNPKVKFTNAVHNHPLVLGCALQDDGTPFRYEAGTIGHITVKWL